MGIPWWLNHGVIFLHGVVWEGVVGEDILARKENQGKKCTATACAFDVVHGVLCGNKEGGDDVCDV